MKLPKRYIDLGKEQKIDMIKEFIDEQSLDRMEAVIASCFWDRFEIWVEDYLAESHTENLYKER